MNNNENRHTTVFYSLVTCIIMDAIAFLANNSAAEGPTKKSFRGTRSGAAAEMQRTTFGVCPFRGWAGGQKIMCFLCVCVYVCGHRNAIVIPIDFLIYRTDHGVCIENVSIWSLNRTTGGVVQASLLVPNYLMGAAQERVEFVECACLSVPHWIVYGRKNVWPSVSGC